jgi:oxygen-dependent protoporphyrinogen oxidase
VIAIVGAGITGLAIAHELSRSGEPHIVLEADDRPGGAIRSGHVDGSLLEWGPQRIRLAPTLHDLIRELGIEGDLVMAPPELPLYVFARGKLRRVPFSFRELARTDLVTTRGKIRMMVEPLTRGAKPGEHVGPFLRRKAGVEAYRNLLGPLYGGLYGSDPDDMLVDLSLGPMLRQSEVGRSLLIALARRGGRITPPPAASFVNGLQTFTDALYRANREAIRLSTRVDVIRPVSDGY